MVVADAKVAMDPRGLSRVEELFHRQIEEGAHPGASLAVYRGGQPVLELYGGLADRESGRPVDEQSLFVLYSSTKPLTACCLYILWERGCFGWDDPVAAYWPGFAQNGKGAVTIRQVLTHQGGFPDTPSQLTWEFWSDWDAVVRAMEAIRPDYPPGKVIAYHPRNFGWVIGELVRRIDGRPIDQFLREEITGPLNLQDAYVGLPEALLGRVSRLYAMEDCDRPGQVTIYNRPEVHRSVQPAGGGIASAPALARFYAMLAAGGTLDGVTTLRAETIEEVTRPHLEGMDYTLERRVVRGLGMSLADPRSGEALDLRTFGHAGSGTSIGWANRDLELAAAYITNGFRAEATNTPRLAAISQAVVDACL